MYWYTVAHLTIMLAVWIGLCVPVTASAAPRKVEEGILWEIPAWLKPDLSLAHPRVIYTKDDVARACANVAPGVPAWGKTVLDGMIQQANGFDISDEQIRRMMPRPYSYYMYSDTFKTCPDGSAMKWAGLDHPGKVYCSGRLLPDAAHPDDGHGWIDDKGKTYYFTARWNGAYVEHLTGMLEPLALAYSLTDDREYAHKAAVILDALATIYPTAIEGPLDYAGLKPGYEGGRLERPFYQTARVLVKYVNTVDLIWGSGELDRPSVTNPGLSVRENIVYNMLLNGGDYCYREAHKPGYVDQLHNGTADYNKGILAVGSLLGIDAYVDWAVNGPTSFAVMLSNNINRNGLYFETTSDYTESVRTIYMEIAEMFYKLRTPRFPKGVNMFDNPRFAALYKDSRELMFIAGRVPSYGDSGADEATGVRKPFGDAEARQLLRFAVRVSGESKRQEYMQLVASITRSPVYAAADMWGLFKIGSTPEYIAAVDQPIRQSEVAGGAGFADDQGLALGGRRGA